MKLYIFTFSLIIYFGLYSSYVAIAQDRAMWATIWSISTPDKIDKIIETAKDYNFNKIFLQARYRADAMYFTNRLDSSYENKETRTYLLKDSKFDPLLYAINKTRNLNIEIHAWVPIFVATPHDLTKINDNHIYYLHPEWITVSDKGKKMRSDEHEGAFLDPGIPQVQSYLLNILSDIALNYDVDGIQLDYIRYPDSIYGFNPIAIENYKNSSDTIFDIWKQKQINAFVNKAYIQLKNINSSLQISASVFANQDKAVNQFSQNWKMWLINSYIDQVYVMAYNISNSSFEKVLESINDVKKKKTTIILRAWKDKKPYYAHQINEKIKLSKKYEFLNLGFYSYSGMIKNNYLNHIKF
jgi:uncharacterized lipoprotein YddW (UPF0748 family)